MPGGIVEALKGPNSVGAPNVAAIERKLSEIADAAKLKATAQAVGALIRDDEGPSRDTVDTTAKTIGMAKDLAEMESERVRQAREEAEALRQRVQELEERVRESRREERRDQMDAFSAMASMLTTVLAEARQNQAELTKMVLEVLQQQRQPQSDPIKDTLVNTALQMAFQRSDPDEEARRRIQWAREMAEALGYRRDTGNVVNIDAARAAHEMKLAERRLELEEKKLERELAVEEARAKSMAEAVSTVGQALAGRLPAQGGGKGGLAGTRVHRYRCLGTLEDGSTCNAVAMFDRPVTDYECPSCHQRVIVGGPQPIEEGGSSE